MNKWSPEAVPIDDNDVHEIVVDAVTTASAGLQARPAVLEPETRIFGRSGFMDSVGLVSLVLEIERQLEEKYGISIPIMDDKAFSTEHSPFQSLNTLEHYVAQRIRDVCCE